MKPTKNAVAVVIKNELGQFLVVKRPENEDGPLAGVWGFPAVTMVDGETEEDAARRVGQIKLGVNLKPISKIGERVGDRGTYTLHLSDYIGEILNSETPTVPQTDVSVTQYTDLKYTNDPKILFPAAQKGSLCSQVYLHSIGVDWSESAKSAIS